jgi:hypothetical protein
LQQGKNKRYFGDWKVNKETIQLEDYTIQLNTVKHTWQISIHTGWTTARFFAAQPDTAIEENTKRFRAGRELEMKTNIFVHMIHKS